MVKSVTETSNRKLTGLLGGTFDPIHHGHLRMAEQLADALQLDTVRFIPCGNPPHRDSPVTSAVDRSTMVKLAIAGNPRFVIDDRELARDGPSYTYDTLISLREECGEDAGLCLFMGSDAFSEFDNWHRWQEISELCHLVLVERPDAESVSNLRPDLMTLLNERRVEHAASLAECPAGLILIQRIQALNISATTIRKELGTQRSPRYLLPDTVLDYIHQQGLYR